MKNTIFNNEHVDIFRWLKFGLMVAQSDYSRSSTIGGRCQLAMATIHAVTVVEVVSEA